MTSATQLNFEQSTETAEIWRNLPSIDSEHNCCITESNIHSSSYRCWRHSVCLTTALLPDAHWSIQSRGLQQSADHILRRTCYV